MDLRSVERVRKRKNEDEEFMFVILPALYFHLTWQNQRQQRHLSFVYGKEHVRELLGGHLKNCLAAFRMEPNIFMWLASYLREEGLILDSRIKVEEKLAFFLYMLSHNASYEKMQLEFKHSGWSFSKYVTEFFDIIPTLTTRIVKPLNLYETHPRIATDRRFFPYFQNCIGAIDGSHVPVTRTPSRASPWRNRKGTLSQNSMFTCDFDLGQSGVGWNESKFMLDAEPHLWDNLAISFGPRILKFKKKPFPLYETLANLYHKHTAEGNFNFTSTADQKPHMDIETDSDDDDENRDADFEILEQPHVEHVQDNQVNQRQVGLEAGLEHVLATQTQASVTSVEANQRNGAGPSTNKPRKRKSSPKMKPKSTGDALVGVIDRFVNIKEKEVNNEAAQQFTISKCIAALRTLEGFDPAKKPKAFVVFKSVDNREIFLSSVEDNDGSALAWLNGEMAMLP